MVIRHSFVIRASTFVILSYGTFCAASLAVSENFTGVPALTILASRRASQLVSRKQPCEPVFPINSGFGLLAAAIVLAVMILPTVASIAEDAIRAVPREYKEGSLALGATHWQAITGVILPAARSGLAAAVILGVGRALGETMAMIMVIGNSVIVPQPLDRNPLTIVLSQARTLTGNIAVEISYATGLQEKALFATGIVLFALIMLVNSTAHLLMGRRAR